jgi:hypothetical protein
MATAQRSVQDRLEKLKREPTVRQVQEAALRYFKVNQNTVASMRNRAGIKGLVPVMEVAGGYNRSNLDEDTINQEFDRTDPWIIKGAGGNAWNVRGKLTWNLPLLVFNAEELDVASLAGLMEGLLKESTRLYFMRRRLQVDMILSPPTNQASLLSKQLRLEELTGLLDAMTGGWFGKELDRREKLALSSNPGTSRNGGAIGPVMLKASAPQTPQD